MHSVNLLLGIGLTLLLIAFFAELEIAFISLNGLTIELKKTGPHKREYSLTLYGEPFKVFRSMPAQSKYFLPRHAFLCRQKLLQILFASSVTFGDKS